MSEQVTHDAERCARVYGALGLILASEFKRGDSILYLASRYSLKVDDVEDCLRHMMRSAGV